MNIFKLSSLFLLLIGAFGKSNITFFTHRNFNYLSTQDTFHLSGIKVCLAGILLENIIWRLNAYAYHYKYGVFIVESVVWIIQVKNHKITLNFKQIITVKKIDFRLLNGLSMSINK